MKKAWLRVLIPARHHRPGKHGLRPAFVSPSTAAIETVINPSTDDIVTVTDVSPGSTSCGAPLADGSRICTVVVLAPPGNDTFAFSTWDQIVANTIPPEANELGTATLTQQIYADTLNTLNVYISGIIASFEAMPTFSSLPAYGSPNTYTFTIYADDADGDRITATNGGPGASDPYANGGITASLDAEGSSHATLTVNGGPPSANSTVLYSGDSLVLHYDGAGTPNYSALVTLSAANVAQQPQVRISPMFITSGSRAFGSATPYTLNLYYGLNADLTVSEFGAPATTAYAESASSCSGVATLQSSGGTTFDVGSGTTAGKNCTVSVTDGTSTDTIAVTNTTGSATITTPRFTSYAAGGNPFKIAAGPDGRLWFLGYDTVIRAITTAGVVTPVATISSNPVQAESIDPGSDGNMWFAVCTGPKKTGPGTDIVGYVAPSTGVETRFPDLYSGGPGAMTSGPDGNMWLLTELGLVRATEGGAFTQFVFDGSGSTGLVSDGTDLWLTDYDTPSLQEFAPDGTHLRTYPVMTPGAELLGLVRGADGSFYFADVMNESIDRMTPSGVLKTFPVGITVSAPIQGPDGAIWFVGGNTLDRLSTAGSGTVTSYPFPAGAGNVLNVVVGPDGAFWATDYFNKIWRAAI